jgi:hypothetical protein
VPLQLNVYDPDLRAGTFEKLVLDVVGKEVTPTPNRQVVEPIERMNGRRVSRGPSIFSQPRDGALVVGRVAGPIQADARYDGWWRVHLGAKHFGWVDGKTVKNTQAEVAIQMPTLVQPRGPAVIAFDEARLARRTAADTVDLVGEVVASQAIKDVRIYLNQKKIFFRSNSQNEPKPSDRRSTGNRLLFSTRLHLERGPNYIEVVTRSRTDGTASRAWFIHRSR